MSVNIRYPNITATNEKEQLAQIKSYLHQLVENLNYAMSTIGKSSGTGENTSSEKTKTASTGTVEVQGGEMSYYELRTLIIQDLQKVNDLFDQLYRELEADKESGEFDGEDGYTPIKGKDYFTEEEINSVAKDAADKISFTLDEEGNLYYEVEE